MLPPTINIGIMSAGAIAVYLHGSWLCSDGKAIKDKEMRISHPCELNPLSPESTFTLRGVTIGKTYHWQREQDQTFIGKLSFIAEGEMLTAVNTLPIEDYLVSVISSEMSATASVEFLKASAVISRSWAVKTIIAQRAAHNIHKENPADAGNTPNKLICWQDHEQHSLYDVCADDHCQRYQGITRATNDNVQRAVSDTLGEVLTYQGEVCDCRFSKCCGGKTEEFDTCWQDKSLPYLQSIEDKDPKDGTIFCNTQDKAILAQVLNDYDQETADFYRWEVSYTLPELSRLLSRKLNRDFGRIIELRPLRRGASGRICELEIVGSKDNAHFIIGKELTIREALSESHLLSSAFEVERHCDAGIEKITLHGKGWGHGVGLCQIGAAVMGSKGYDYREILAHYYPHTEILKIQDLKE